MITAKHDNPFSGQSTGPKQHQFSLKKLLLFCYTLAFLIGCCSVFPTHFLSDPGPIHPAMAAGIALSMSFFAVGGLGAFAASTIYVGILCINVDSPQKRQRLIATANFFMICLGVIFCPVILLFFGSFIIELWT